MNAGSQSLNGWIILLKDKLAKGVISMLVIVTGGSGLIGRALTASLTKEGNEVIVLSRSPDRVAGLPAGAKAASWDGKSTDGWGDLVDGATAIVNLAGESIAGDSFIPSRWTADRKRRIRESRTNAGKALVAAVAAASNKPEMVIQSSAIGYYGPHEDELIDETYPAADDYLASVCVDWENSTVGVEELGVRRAIIRSGLVFTALGGIFTRLQLPFKLFAGGPMGSGNQYYSWIHMDDHIAAIRFLIDEQKAQGAFNLTAPNPVTSRQFGVTLGKVMSRPSFMPVPGFAMKMALGEVSMTALEGQRVIPKQLQELGFEFIYPDLEEALLEIVNQ
jgi:uncharacterized protein (TIGR01777 family)